MNLALELLLSAAGMILGIVLIAEAVWQAQNSWENETDGPDGCLDAGSGAFGIVFYLFSVYYHRKITGGREAGDINRPG